MRFWPFRRKTDDAPREDLDAAHWEADRALRDAKQLSQRADEVTGRLGRTWERNHIAEAVTKLMRGMT